MKRTFFAFLILSLALGSCSSSQQILNSWINKEELPRGPFKSIFIMSLVENEVTRKYVENQLEETFELRGLNTINSYEVFPGSTLGMLTKEQIVEAVNNSGAEAVITLALLDVKSTSSYQPGTAYYPMTTGFHDSYYGYYNYYAPVVVAPGYYINDQTYYIETNFYDITGTDDMLLWSIQSDAYNPVSLEKWYREYTKMILYKLRKEGLIKN